MEIKWSDPVEVQFGGKDSMWLSGYYYIDAHPLCSGWHIVVKDGAAPEIALNVRPARPDLKDGDIVEVTTCSCFSALPCLMRFKKWDNATGKPITYGVHGLNVELSWEQVRKPLPWKGAKD